MSYRLILHWQPTYLHAVVSGTNSRENVQGYLAEIEVECAARGYVRVLIEERLEGPRLGPTDVFDIAAEGSRRSGNVFQAIAYVDVNADGSLMKFAETVAINRGLPVRLFSNVADGEQWLRGQGN